MQHWWVDLIAAVATFTVCLIGSAITQIQHIKNNAQILSTFNCFGGGILLSVAVIHMIPELNEIFHDVESLHGYPIGMLFVILGYLILLVLEKVIFRHEHHHTLKNETSPIFEEETKGPDVTVSEVSTNLKYKNHHHDETPEIDHNHRPAFEKEGSLVTPILLFLALSAHSIFEGIVLGLQTNTENALTIFLAMIFHKPFEALALGILMTVEQIDKSHFILITILFASVTPTGIAIGLLLNNNDPPPFLIGTFTGLAVGSFIYISTTEIIADEFVRTNTRKEKWIKLFSVFLGLVFISVVQIWLGHHEDHMKK